MIEGTEGEKGLEMDFEGEGGWEPPCWIWKSKHVYWEKGVTQRVEICVFLDEIKKFTGRRPSLLPGCVNFYCGPCLFLESGSLSLTFHLVQITVNYQLVLKTV